MEEDCKREYLYYYDYSIWEYKCTHCGHRDYGNWLWNFNPDRRHWERFVLGGPWLCKRRRRSTLTSCCLFLVAAEIASLERSKRRQSAYELHLPDDLTQNLAFMLQIPQHE